MISLLKADKGDTIVVETTENYIKDGLTHLSNQNTIIDLLKTSIPILKTPLKSF